MCTLNHSLLTKKPPTKIVIQAYNTWIRTGSFLFFLNRHTIQLKIIHKIYLNDISVKTYYFYLQIFWPWSYMMKVFQKCVVRTEVNIYMLLPFYNLKIMFSYLYVLFTTKRYTYIELFLWIILRYFNDLRWKYTCVNIDLCNLSLPPFLIRRIFQLCFEVRLL